MNGESEREAVCTETMQIAIVVRDLDATLRRYIDDYEGISIDEPAAMRVCYRSRIGQVHPLG